jgi:hypothetical protein
MQFTLNETGLADLAERYPVEDDHSALLALETAILGNGGFSSPLITGPCELSVDLLANGYGVIDGYRLLIRPSEDADDPFLASHIQRVTDLIPLTAPDDDGGLYDTAEIIRSAVRAANELLAWFALYERAGDG